MKTLSKLLFVVFSFVFVLACSKTSDDILPADLKSSNLGADKTHETKTVTVPFKAHFSVWRATAPGEGEACDEGLFRENMAGGGEMTHLGEMTTSMSFCVNGSDFSYAFTDVGTFVAANGDELYFSVPTGQIFPYTGDDPFYNLAFNDEMIFMGGTGRFEGATGTAMTNAFVHMGSGDESDPFRTDFFSEGTLTLVKGKK